jgi:hypothetical protein
VSNFYDRAGQLVDLMTWTEKNDPEYKRVAEDTVSPYWISTVWLGIDHQHGDGPPLIFETMVFRLGPDGEVNFSDIDCDRYSTEAEALEGHRRMVDKWTPTAPDAAATAPGA